MLKIFLLLLSVLVLANASDYSRANIAAKDAHKDFDCDFGDCPKAAPKPLVIIKETVIVKEVPVVVEKVVYKDKPQVQEEVTAPVVEPKAILNRVYNKAFFDVHTRTQAPMLDYISFTKRGSFDIEQFVDTVNKIKEEGTKVYIHGSIKVPESVKTDQVYVSSGKKYHYYDRYGPWAKEIYYNGSQTRQNSDYFLVDVKTDINGERYIDYKIYIMLRRPWVLKASEENVAPNSFFFKMAPKTRGFKNKFAKAEIFIVEE